MLNIFERLAILSDFLQLANYEQNINQTSNDAIMQELQRQNNEYLEEIKKMLNEINAKIERIENAQR